MLRVLVVVGPCLYREGLADALARMPGIAVVGVAADADQAAVELVALQGPPDAVLIDTWQPNALESMPRLRTLVGDAKIVALALAEREADVLAWSEAGISGYVTPDDSIADLVRCLETVERDGAAFPPPMVGALLRRVAALAAGSVAGAGDSRSLTVREREIVSLIDQGFSNKEIAQQLRIELSTVKNHVHNVLEKLGVRRRGDAAARLRGS